MNRAKVKGKQFRQKRYQVNVCVCVWCGFNLMSKLFCLHPIARWKRLLRRKSSNHGIRTHNWIFRRYQRRRRVFHRSEKSASSTIQWISWMRTCCPLGISTIWPARENCYANHRSPVILTMNTKCDESIQWSTMFIGVSSWKVRLSLEFHRASFFATLRALRSTCN